MMPMLTYLVKSEALARVQRRAQAAYNADDASDMLDLTVGTKTLEDTTTETHYRPDYVAAKLLEMNSQHLVEAEGTEFTDRAISVQALLDWQKAYDTFHELTIPKQFQAYSKGILNAFKAKQSTKTPLVGGHLSARQDY
jgi:hypothetical protein